eukprot:gene45802-57075_t
MYASQVCSRLLRQRVSTGPTISVGRSAIRWHNGARTKALPQPQSHPPIGSAVSRKESGGQRNMSDTTSVYQAYQGNTYLFGGNAPYVEEMYENYLANPGSVPDNWREYFDALQHVPAVDGSNAKDVPHLPV